MRFTLSEAQTGAIAIPAGTRVTDGEAYFTTDKYAEIKAGETTVDVACTSIETGVDLNGSMREPSRHSWIRSRT